MEQSCAKLWTCRVIVVFFCKLLQYEFRKNKIDVNKNYVKVYPYSTFTSGIA